jgi:hypothetical protein
MRRIAWFPGALALTALAAGCVGQIGDPSGGAANNGLPEDDPGRVTMHRLNKVEYNNTVRDLLGTKLTPADDFPADDISYGFDNISDVLTTSPLHVELYERSAELLIEEAMSVPSTAKTHQAEAETLQGTAGQASGEAWNLYSAGEVGFSVPFPVKGEYKISAHVWGKQAGSEPAKANLLAGGVPFGPFDVTATESSPTIIETTVTIEAGNKQVAVEFINDYYDSATMADRNLYVDWIRVEGPLNQPGSNEQRDRIVICDLAQGEACVKQILTAFGRRAWRRPVTDAEMAGLMKLVAIGEQQGDGVEGGLKVALRAILTAPYFVFRVEKDPNPTSLMPHPLDAFELASRLSYFLWSSTPDDALLDAAADGSLLDVEELRAQVDRMLDDPRSEGFVESFAGQWLYTRALDDHEPDYVVYPAYNEEVAAAMKMETKLFFREFLHSERGMDELLTADFTFANDTLATYYGLPPVGSDEHQMVTFADAPRKGILTQGSLLTVTSHPTRTSPVKRGKWVLTQLLCSKPADPPPGVEGLMPAEMPSGTLRELLEQHRANPVCASCHDVMDPLGFGLEGYDGVGAFRTKDTGGFDIDSSGELPTGEKFTGALEMADIIASDPRYSRCVSKQLLTFALGRGTDARDREYLEHITNEFTAGGSKLRDLIKLVVTSEPFRLRRGEASEARVSGSEP